jgi:hypothetical protein
MEHSKHIWRGAILLVLALVGIVVGRHFMVPASFGEMGYYRGDALYEFMDKAPEHGAVGACAECHDDVAAAKAAGKHASVQCEACHAPLSTHVRDGEMVGEMAINRSYRLCAYCHQELVARPATIAQINLADHLDLGPEDVIPEHACLECHDAEAVHSP